MDACHNLPCVRRNGGPKDGVFCVCTTRHAVAEMPSRQRESHDRTALFESIKACCKYKDLQKGSKIHADILQRGLLRRDITLGNALLSMYAKCGALEKAQEVFNELPARDAVTWTALIAGYAQHGIGHEALSCFEQMRDGGISPDVVTFACLLKACGSIGAAGKGEDIHAELGRQGLLEKNTVLGNALVDMYVKCGKIAKAQEVFEEHPARNIVTWNALIAGYAQHELGDEALRCFERMRDEGLIPDAVTFTCILKVCGSRRAAEKGAEVHAKIGQHGLLEKDIVLGNALVDMYVKCGMLAKARAVFDELPEKDLITWNVLIAGYAQHGFGEEALSCFGQMLDEGLSPDAVTFACILKACGSIRAAEMGKEIHAWVDEQGLLEKSIVLGTALMDMYVKCGALAKAQEVFNKLPALDVVAWNVLIDGYAQHGLGDEALSCFGCMRDKGFSPDVVSFACILKACGIIGAAKKGEEIHFEVGQQGLLRKNVVLGIAMVDMYAKCGTVGKAQAVFDEVAERNLVMWTALMAGYAQVGNVKIVFDSFSKMIREGIEPSGVTFIVLLTACSHAGLLEEGQRYFDTMSTVYCIIPTLEHHTCMVDNFGRAGQFNKARSVIEKVPHSERLALCLALMGACQKWVDVELGKWAFEYVGQLDEKSAAAYVCMSNIYASADMQEEADI